MRTLKTVARRTLGAASLAALLAAPALASASPEFTLNRFAPAERGSRWFALDSLEIEGEDRWAVGLVGDYSFRPLAARNADKDDVQVVRHSVVGNLGASLVLGSRVRVGANLPVALAYGDSFGAARFRGVNLDDASGARGVGDLRLSVDYRLTGLPTEAFTEAVGASLIVPVGSSYLGSGEFGGNVRYQVAGSVKRYAYAARVGGTFTPERDLVDRDGKRTRTVGGPSIDLGASFGHTYLDRRLLVGPELWVTTPFSSDWFSGPRTGVDALFGAHYDTSKSIRVGAAAGRGLTSAPGEAKLRVLASVEWAPAAAPADADGDGVADAQDACPRAPGVRTADARTNGCSDRDSDGVLDSVDACPEVAGLAANNGCLPPPVDTDADGIADAQDACVSVAGVASTDVTKNGCPVLLDGDADGIVDASDACPAQAGVKSEDPKQHGCPDLDADKDGVALPADQCADLAGLPSLNAAQNGCPVGHMVADQLVVTGLRFKQGSAELDASAEAVLTRALEVLRGLSKTTEVMVEGHTSLQGPDAGSRQLSERRAKAVAQWLAAKGFDKKRIKTKGLGNDKPLSAEATEVAQSANSRIELRVSDPVAAKEAAKKAAADKAAADKAAAEQKKAAKKAEKEAAKKVAADKAAADKAAAEQKTAAKKAEKEAAKKAAAEKAAADKAAAQQKKAEKEAAKKAAAEKAAAEKAAAKQKKADDAAAKKAAAAPAAAPAAPAAAPAAPAAAPAAPAAAPAAPAPTNP